MRPCCSRSRHAGESHGPRDSTCHSRSFTTRSPPDRCDRPSALVLGMRGDQAKATMHELASCLG
jgi:hypothetical protein